MAAKRFKIISSEPNFRNETRSPITILSLSWSTDRDVLISIPQIYSPKKNFQNYQNPLSIFSRFVRIKISFTIKCFIIEYKNVCFMNNSFTQCNPDMTLTWPFSTLRWPKIRVTIIFTCLWLVYQDMSHLEHLLKLISRS